MTKFVLPAAALLALGLSGAAWADCTGHQKTDQTSAEAPVDKPVQPLPQS